jgi:magnesium-transporting ATPase (P-type)
MFKLLIETVYWNVVSAFFILICIFLYFVIVAIGNTNIIASYFQPQINGQFNLMFANPKFWLVFFGIPGIALLPDITYMFMQRIFFPTPTDAVMHKQSENPKYKYQGFGNYDSPINMNTEI